jgi:hypothetical protein
VEPPVTVVVEWPPTVVVTVEPPTTVVITPPGMVVVIVVPPWTPITGLGGKTTVHGGLHCTMGDGSGHILGST